MAHPAVMIPVTSWSLPSSGGGGDNRVPGSRVCFTPLGYEVPRRRGDLLDRAADPGPDDMHANRGRDVLNPRSRRPDEGSGR